MIFYPLRFLFVSLYKCWLGFAQTVLRPSGTVLELEISDISEQPMPISWLSGGPSSLMAYRRLLKRAADDPNIDGLILRIDGLEETGYSSIEELREQVRKFSRSGKFTVAYLDSVGMKPYYLASICDRIFMNPTAALGPLGLHMQQSFLKGTLEKLGVEPHLERAGDYKSAAEMFQREGMSEEHKEMMNWLIDGLYDEVVTEIHARRGLTREAVHSILDEGFLTAEEACDAGLVDDLVHQQDLEEWVRERTGQYSTVSSDQYVGRWLPSEVNWRSPRRIAVLFADGPIHSGNGTLMPNNTVGSRTLMNTLQDIRQSGQYDAILFRVNSPGGSAVASDKIAREIQRTREEDQLPVVASMGDVAASGGYYISALAHPIYANRATITGSIGVVMGKFTVDKLQDKIGYRTESVKRGERADMNSPVRKWNKGEHDKIRSMIRNTYDQFVDVVEEGREQSRDRIEEVAQGKVWTGEQARSNELVDEIGGFDEALRDVRSKAGLTEDDPVALDPYPVQHFNLFGSWTGTVLNVVKRIITRGFRFW